MNKLELWFPPEFYHQIKHNKLRRAHWHDYHLPSFYLITLMKKESPGVPPFSSLIKKENGEIDVKFSWSGWAIYNAMQKFSEEYPFIKLGRFVIMPDHVHSIMQVTEKTQESLGFYINRLKTYSTQCFRSKSQVRSPSEESVFERGFNDRILTQEGQLKNWNSYVLDNPRRLWLMRNIPDYFSRTYLFARACPSYLWDLSVSEAESKIMTHKFPTFGNAQLLRYPEKAVIRFSRRFSKEDWEKMQESVMRVAKNGGVLVTPAIHEEEKRLLREGLLLSGRVIKVIGYGFPAREKPQGEDFHHCAEGRMLLFALNQYEPGIKREAIHRILCERMNATAEWIVSTRF